MRRTVRWHTVVAVGASFLLGCSGNTGPVRYPVTGAVLLDGQPLPDGDVILIEMDRPAQDAGKIVKGKYQMQATAGKKKVYIQASKISPNSPLGIGDKPIPVEYIPKKYNDKSTLTAEVAAGVNRFDFELESR